jgi:hypothetical protein
MEHRCGYRRAAATKVRLRTSNGVTADGEICDVSSSGALLRSHLPVSVHAVLSVRLLTVRNAPSGESTVSAEVVRHVSGGFAVEWTEFSPGAIRVLLRDLRGESAAPGSDQQGAPSTELIDCLAGRKG